MGSMIGSGLYAVLMVIFLVMYLTWKQADIAYGKAFCAGTTAAYRKGDAVNSALAHQSRTKHSTHSATVASCFGAQASTSAMAPTSAKTPSGTTCRELRWSLAFMVSSLTF